MEPKDFNHFLVRVGLPPDFVFIKYCTLYNDINAIYSKFELKTTSQTVLQGRTVLCVFISIFIK